MIGHIVRLTLENHGMSCMAAHNGVEALRLLHEEQPDAAVLDINMPEKDGYEVLESIRAERLPIPVVLLTAYQHEKDVLRGFRLGADDYVLKPFNPIELVARLNRLLNR